MNLVGKPLVGKQGVVKTESTTFEVKNAAMAKYTVPRNMVDPTPDAAAAVFMIEGNSNVAEIVGSFRKPIPVFLAP